MPLAVLLYLGAGAIITLGVDHAALPDLTKQEL